MKCHQSFFAQNRATLPILVLCKRNQEVAMASKKENAPVCPACGRSEGVSGEASVGFEWSRGAWRAMGEPEFVPDLECPCGHVWLSDGED